MKKSGRYYLLRTAYGVCAAIVIAWSLLPEFGGKSPSMRHLNASADDLRTIGKALLKFTSDHDGKYPDDLSAFADSVYWPEGYELCNENGGLEYGLVCTTEYPFLKYIYLANSSLGARPSDKPLLVDDIGNHRGFGVNVLFTDLHIEFSPRKKNRGENKG